MAHHSNPPQLSPFLRGWNSLPPELRLQILSHVLTISPISFKGPNITIHDYMSPLHISKRVPRSNRFSVLAVPLLACPTIDTAFHMPKAALETWYGANTVFLGGTRRGCGEKLAYPYLVPNRVVFASLQRVRVHIRGDRAGWTDLARYCEASGDMPKLKVFELGFVRQASVDADYEALRHAFFEVGPLEVSAGKFVIEYYGKNGLLDPVRASGVEDQFDYPEMAGVFGNISVASGGKVVKEVVQRYWYDCVTRVDVDEMWELPPKSIYPWLKHVVRTQWL